MARPDALLVTALQDELEAVLALGDGGKAGWRAMRDGRGFRYHVRETEGERGEPLVLAAAWTGEMGEAAAAARAQQLIDELDPGCIAMCGICVAASPTAPLQRQLLDDQKTRARQNDAVSGRGPCAPAATESVVRARVCRRRPPPRRCDPRSVAAYRGALASRARQTCANMGQGAPRTGSRNR